MPGRAWLILLPLAALSQGCVVVSADPATVTPTPSPKRTAPVAQTPRFKEMISAPGQTVAKLDVQPATPAPATADVHPPLAQTSASEPRLLPDPPVVAAVRAYLDNRTTDAAELLRGLEPANREAIIRLLPALATAKSGKLTPGGADAGTYAHLLATAAESAARQAPLRVKKACFVASVRQYGVYEPLPEGKRFLPGGEGQLYLELANVASDPTDSARGGQGYVTQAECVLHLTDAAGRTFYRFDATNCPDMLMKEPTRSPIRDSYFLSLFFRLPKEPGTYMLTFEYRELSTNRSVRHAVEVVVGP